MFRKWHHGHSLGFGILAGFAVASYRPWLIFAAGVLAGVIATLTFAVARKVIRELGYRTGRYVAARRAQTRNARMGEGRIPY